MTESFLFFAYCSLGGMMGFFLAFKREIAFQFSFKKMTTEVINFALVLIFGGVFLLVNHVINQGKIQFFPFMLVILSLILSYTLSLKIIDKAFNLLYGLYKKVKRKLNKMPLLCWLKNKKLKRQSQILKQEKTKNI